MRTSREFEAEVRQAVSTLYLAVNAQPNTWKHTYVQSPITQKWLRVSATYAMRDGVGLVYTTVGANDEGSRSRTIAETVSQVMTASGYTYAGGIWLHVRKA